MPATIVDLAGYRRSEANPGSSLLRSAELLSMRQHLQFHASIEIDDLLWLQAQFDDRLHDHLLGALHSLLDKEFGHLRVSQYRRLFIVRHRSVEGLIAGLLRAQFRGHKIELPICNAFGESVEQHGIALTWGIGRSSTEAELERLKRRRQKNCRR